MARIGGWTRAPAMDPMACIEGGGYGRSGESRSGGRTGLARGAEASPMIRASGTGGLSRRRFLRAAGVSMALPRLESSHSITRAATAGPISRRLVAIETDMGILASSSSRKGPVVR